MEVKILGGGCAKCERLESLTRDIIGELGFQATFTKVKDMIDIMAYDVITTPALVVNEKVLSQGRIPTREEIRQWLAEIGG